MVSQIVAFTVKGVGKTQKFSTDSRFEDILLFFGVDPNTAKWALLIDDVVVFPNSIFASPERLAGKTAEIKILNAASTSTGIPAVPMEKNDFVKDFDGRKWTMLMKLGKDGSFSFKSHHWSDKASVVAEFSQSNDQFNGLSAKLPPYNTMKVRYLMLVTLTGRVILELPNGDKPLVDYFQTTDTVALKYISGVRHPLLLAQGRTELSSGETTRLVEPAYRLNCKHTVNNFGARIGGAFAFSWGTDYGVDSQGNTCCAEVAGCGLMDEVYSPFAHANKSFGVRQAHDRDAVPKGGQVSAECHIYACP